MKYLKITTRCKYCDKRILKYCVAPQKEYYCSRKHFVLDHTVARRCQTCNKLHRISKFKLETGRGIYCSRRCFDLRAAKQNQCPHCGTWFRVTNNRQKFCSTKCHHRSRTIPPVKCEYCGALKQRSKSRSRRGRNFCSHAHYISYYRQNVWLQTTV